MQRDKYFAISPIERVSDAGSATGQKNYALAWQRAARLNPGKQAAVEASCIVQISAEALSTDKELVQKRILYPHKI